MDHLIILIAHHGYLVVFLIVLAEALDMPLPASLALIAAGAAAASGALRAPLVFLFAVAALLLGDSIIYFLGRYMGWALLGFLCKVSVNPETCILRSAELFYKRGKTTLIIAKFIPGINTMAPPLAGSMKMRFEQFLWFDFVGASLYALAYGGVGYLFHRFLTAIARALGAAGHVAAIGVVIVLAAYVAYRLWLYRKNRIYRVVPRVQIGELIEKLKSEEGDKILLVDVRSHGYYDASAARIKGSIRIEPNNLNEEVKHLPKDKDIYLYCTCVREATSARVGHMLRERGFNAFVIVGGLAAWRKAGLAVETVPEDDLVHLPTFS
jgi:membrane protein DedA with SNARE-associated domain/rhodanese-related sulfurtransferase